MYSFTKKLVATAMAFAMTMGVSVTAMAAEESNVKVQINGVNLDMSGNAPIMKSNRVYVPMRTIFEGLGAEVVFDEVTGTITATRSTETVQFVVGNKDLNLDKAGVKSIVTTDTPAFVEKDTTYVPVRFIADALGCTVNWDNDAQTAVIIDSNKLLSDLNGKFTIMDKFLMFNKEFTSTAQKFSGALNYDMKITNPTAGGKEIPVKLTGTLSGISDADKMNMKIALKMDPESLKLLLAEAFATAEGTTAEGATAEGTVAAPSAEEIKEITDVVNNLNFDFIMDTTSGKYYMSMPAFETILGLEKNTWYEFDMNAMFEAAGMPGVTMAQLMEMNKTDSFAEAISAMLKVMPITTSESGEAFAQIINLYTTSFADTAFTKEADGYVTTYKVAEAGAETVMTMKLTEAADKITGYKLNMTAKMPGTMDMKIKADQVGSNCTVSMDFNVANFMSMVFNADMKYIKTTDKALSKPSAGAVIVSLNDMMTGGMSIADTEATAEITEEVPEATDAPVAPETEAPATDAPVAPEAEADAPVAPAA